MIHDVSSALRVLGALVVACWGLKVVMGAYRIFLRPGQNLKRRFGDWAMVTGATDGIGQAYAIELAKKKINVVLVSRTQSKLDDMAQTLRDNFGVEARTVAVDLSALDEAARARVAAAVSDIEVGLLVNNAGMSYSFPQYFDQLDQADVDRLVMLNVHSLSHLTHMVLPGMVERRKGAVVNVSSASARFPSPLLAQYGASKAFVEAFSAALHAEYAPKGVHVQCQTPFFVTTKLAKIRKSSLTVPTPERFAKSAVAAIGYESNISPYWAHQIMLSVIDCIPAFIWSKVVIGQHLGLRKRALKKLSKST